MKKKRICALLLAGLMATGCLSACGQSDPAVKESESVVQKESESAAVSSEVVEEEVKEGPITTDPVTVSIFTTRQNGESNDPNNLWFFRYLEYWMNEQGYNVTIDVEQSLEPNEQISLMLATGDVPDLVWGIGLGNSNAVTYGAEDGVVLDWSPYINEEYMPNLCEMLETRQDALAASKCLDGKIYGLPYFADKNEGEGAGNYTGNNKVFINKNWLEACDLEVPDTIDGFLDMLRTFKEEVKTESGEEVVPFVGVGNMLQQYLWTGLGYYGGNAGAYGTGFVIKDEEVYLPAYTEDYATFIEIMSTMYAEGLISQDFFTMDQTTARGLMSSGACGALGDWMLTSSQPETFADWTSALPIAIGDNEVYSSANASYQTMNIWASADTEYPEVLAKMLDYIYSPEGIVHYWYGPLEGQDPLNMVDGWYYKDESVAAPTTKLVEDGSFADITVWAETYIYPRQNTVPRVGLAAYSKQMAGFEGTVATFDHKDAVTGENVVIIKKNYSDDNADGWTRLTHMEAWTDHVTFVRLMGVFMSEEDSVRYKELGTVINEHVNAESAKFITGLRPLEEIDDFQEELKAMGAEEYIELQRKAQEGYLDSVFNK